MRSGRGGCCSVWASCTPCASSPCKLSRPPAFAFLLTPSGLNVWRRQGVWRPLEGDVRHTRHPRAERDGSERLTQTVVVSPARFSVFCSSCRHTREGAIPLPAPPSRRTGTPCKRRPQPTWGPLASSWRSWSGSTPVGATSVPD